jgi:catechol 2,3-dioxygenase-like lactoylglutathione lyase family enzyme
MESFRRSIEGVTSLFHVGVAVSDLSKSIQLLEEYFGFETASRRVVEHAYIGQLIGVPNVSAEIAMLDIGDGNLLELICWRGATEAPEQVIESDLSSKKVFHICIYVANADEWYLKLSKAAEVKLINQAPTVVPFGPNAGSKVFFALVLNEIYFEIFQRIKR